MLAFSLIVSLGAAADQARVRREGSQWIEEASGTAPAASTVVVKLPQGSLVITGGDQQKITYWMKKRAHSRVEAEARKEFQALRLSTHTTRDVTYLTAEGERDGQPRCADLVVTVPRSTKLVKLMSKGGSQRLTGIDGRAEVRLGGGDLNLDQVGGPVYAKVGMGSVEIGSVGGDLTLRSYGAKVRIGSVQGHITVTSGGGDIIIDSASQSITAHTASGDIRVRRSGGDLDADSGGGSLDVKQVNGKATLHTAAGNICLGSATGPVSASTGGGKVKLWGIAKTAEARIVGGGPITAEFVEGNFSGSTLQTPTGDVIVYVSPKLKATIKATVEMANGHHLASHFPEIKISTEGGHYGGPSMMYGEGRLNGGGPVLRVRTTNGNIEIRRAKR